MPTATAEDPEVKAGGVSLTLPGPSSDFVEVGDKLRTTVFELLAPSTNRLLTAYVPPETIAKLNAGKSTGGLELYGLVEVLRQAEYVDCTPAAFQELLKNLGTSFGKAAADKVGDAQEEIAVRLKALGAKPIEIGKPEMLGGIFEKTVRLVMQC